MKQALILILSFFCLWNLPTKAQNLTDDSRKPGKFCTLDSLDYCSTYKMTVVHYECYLTINMFIEITRQNQDYVVQLVVGSNSEFKDNTNFTKSITLTAEQLEKLRQFEFNLGKTHEHTRLYCTGTNFISFSYNETSKWFRYCGCSPNAFLEMKKILLDKAANAPDTDFEEDRPQ
jgi:hypothetical protein